MAPSAPPPPAAQRRLPGYSCRAAGCSRRGAHGAPRPSACPSGAGSPLWGQRQRQGLVHSLPGTTRPPQAQDPSHQPPRPAEEVGLGSARGRGALTAGSVSRTGSAAFPGACGPAGPPSGPEAPSPGGPASLQDQEGALWVPRSILPSLPQLRPFPGNTGLCRPARPDGSSLLGPCAARLSHTPTGHHSLTSTPWSPGHDQVPSIFRGPAQCPLHLEPNSPLGSPLASCSDPPMPLSPVRPPLSSPPCPPTTSHYAKAWWGE